MKKVFLILLCLYGFGLSSAFAQCNDYPFLLNFSGFTCGDGEGNICIETDPGVWGFCYDEYSDYAIQISYLEPNFIYTNLNPGNDVFHFSDVSDPINNPGVTTLQYFQPNPPQDAILADCLVGVLQIPGTVFTLEVVNTEAPFDVIGTATFTLDGGVSIGITGQTSLLTDWIAPNGPLLSAAQALTQGQTVEFNGTIIVNVDYTFDTDPGGQYNELIMNPAARLEIPANTLTLRSANMHGCGANWDRINVQDGGTLTTAFTTISDADVAVELQHNGTYNLQNRTTLHHNTIGIGSFGASTKTVNLNVTTNVFSQSMIRDGVQGIHFENVSLFSITSPFWFQNMSDVGMFLDRSDFNGQFVNFLGCREGIRVPTQNNLLTLDNCDMSEGRLGLITNGTAELEVINSTYFDLLNGITVTDFVGNSHSVIEDNIMADCGTNVFGLVLPSRAEVQYNQMRARNYNVFLWGAAGGDHRWAIQRNPQMLVQNSGYNVYLYGTQNARVFRNDQSVQSNVLGNFYINGGSNNKVGYNLLTGQQDNITLIGSPSTQIYCNNTSSPARGLTVLNDNAGADIRTNDFNGSGGLNLSYGTSGSSFAHTGNQVHKGNLFQASTQTNPRARNFSAASIADDNIFEVGFFEVQGNEKFPFFIANIPFWFDKTGGLDATCPSPPGIIAEEPDIKEVYKKAARSSIDLLNAGVGTSYGSDVEFDAKLKLYRQLAMLNELEPLNEAPMVSWYNILNGSNAQKFVQFETGLRNALALTATEDQQVDALSTDMASLRQEINEIAWFEIGNDHAVTIDPAKKALRDSKLVSLKAKASDRAAIANAKKQALNSQLASLTALNNGVTLTATTAEANLKSANAYLLTRLSPNFSGFSEAQLTGLEAVANQCVGYGGEGVIIARGLVAEAKGTITEYNDECVQEVAPRSSEQVVDNALVISELVVMPNPASEMAIVMFPANSGIKELTISNLLGQQIVLMKIEPDQNQVSLNLNGWLPGAYFIGTNTKGISPIKFFVNK